MAGFFQNLFGRAGEICHRLVEELWSRDAFHVVKGKGIPTLNMGFYSSGVSTVISVTIEIRYR